VGFDAKQQTKQNQSQSVIDADGTAVLKQEGGQKRKIDAQDIVEICSKDATLGSQLASLCMTIIDGESVSVDGIPDEDLKPALESLF